MNTTFLPAELIPTTNGDRKRWGGAHSTSLALAIADAVAQSPKTMWLVITPTTADAYRLQEELAFFLNPENDNSFLDKTAHQKTDSSIKEPIRIELFPDWETLPYDTFSPHEDIISQRIGTLAQLANWSEGILILALPTLMHRLAPTSFVSGHSLSIRVGDQIGIDDLRNRFIKAGYRRVDNVFEHGEFAIRGAILDVFPMGTNQPIRIDYFDDEIETLRTFDPESQRSLDPISSIDLLPAREFPLTDTSLRTFKAQWQEAFSHHSAGSSIYKDIDSGIVPAGIEYYLPLFFDDTSTLFDYLPQNTKVFMPKGLTDICDKFSQDIQQRYHEYNVDRMRPLLAPERLFITGEALTHALKPLPGAIYSKDPVELKAGRINFETDLNQDLQVNAKADTPWKKLTDFLQDAHALDQRVLIAAESAGRREYLIEKLQPVLSAAQLKSLTVYNSWQAYLDQPQSPAILIAPLTHSLKLVDYGITIICESEFFGAKVRQTRRRTTKNQINPDEIIRDLTELRVGAPVVHLEHGVGRYEGLLSLNLGGSSADDPAEAQEFCTLVYANNTKLYVPVSSLHMIARYTGGDAETAPLHRLGSDHWRNERRKAAEKAKDVAAELLQIYAIRAAQNGYAHPVELAAFESFSSEFPFEATLDQDLAINSVLHDMSRQQPMDRLICGDVGFGKTEVAMRAAFIAAHSGKQVAILVPTTLLAQQHFESLRDRFANWPINIEVVSRFKTAKEQNQIMAGIAAGTIDILVGTHKLLQPSVKFKNLGLIVIDEEHRFGVKHKEALKRMRANLDVLTMTATPIPRTLNMSMSGMRDISIIATPPSKRLAVKTFVRESSQAMIKEAILRELLRGGQVFYLHNEVKSIQKTADDLHALVPEARVIIAHGQMRERELEKVMSDFYHHKYNILVCTTIIETGIDIPTANTIIIDRADHFGLAQLHQLRGRVGRSHHQAYAYLLTPHYKSMTKDAIKRLEAIKEADTLGAGFTLASHDLEIRGAGELLGDEQSGHIQTVGYSMFMEMLNRAVQAIKEGKTPNLDRPLDMASEIKLHIPAIIPQSYLPDAHTRLILYKRISSAQTDDELVELKVEFVDRFGVMPQAMSNLFRISHIKLVADTIGIETIDLGENGGKIQFTNPPNIDPAKIIKLIQTNGRDFKLRSSQTLGINKTIVDDEVRVTWLEELLKQLLK